MILKSVRIQNYRSIKDDTLHCGSLTALVGANGSGKSSFLRAVNLFGLEKPDLCKEDYYNGQTDDPIRITVTFSNLSDSEINEFADYILKDDLVVTNILEWNNGKPKPSYRGMRLQNPDFSHIHDDDTKDAKQKYEALRRINIYKDQLPKCSTKDDVKNALRQWELGNPGKCERILGNEKEFKRIVGFPERFVQVLYVPPVRNAVEDAQESKNSVLSKLMELAVHNRLAADDKLITFKESAQSEYDNIMRTNGQNSLNDLGKNISNIVSNFAPQSKVRLTWRSTELHIDPKPEIKLEEDGYPSAVEMAGHGLQRILIMSMLQHLEEEQIGKTEKSAGESPALVILIDEPEIYQHPNRQRHMSKVLRSLAGDNMTRAWRLQVIYSTHSPHFVGIDKLDQVRLVRKVASGNRSPMITRISSTSLDEVAQELAKISGHKKETEDKLARRLEIIMTPMMNEGFFADVVVLVEGDNDRAALMAVAESMGHTFEGLGISIIPCGGKDSLDRPIMVFRKLKIPLYVVWDEDYEKQSSTRNREILAVLGQNLVERPAEVSSAYACLRNKLEKVIKDALGCKFQEYSRRCADDLGMKNRKKLIKTPHTVSYLIKAAMGDDIRFQTLEQIVQNVIKLCPDSQLRI